MKSFVTAAGIAALVAAGGASASVTVIADAALQTSSSLYSNSFGDIVVMTDGGHAPGVGLASGRNDDGFSGPINLGYTLTNFFGHDYTQFWVNNNGNITFNGGVSRFTPEGPQGATQPVIAPFFADADSRGANSGVVHLNQSIPGETIVTWDRVGYFDSHDDLRDTFQLVLRSPDFTVPQGEGQIGFFWNGMQWETGDASGGTNGFGGDPAAVGFGDGNANGFVLQSSTHDGISSVVQDHSIWFNLGSQGEPVPVPAVPEPESWALMLVGLVVTSAMVRRARRND